MFNRQISGASIGGVTLKQGGSVIPTTATLYDGDQGIQLRPSLPLATGTVYTINVTGVKDITGNAQSSFPSRSFTTGTGTDLVTPTVVSTYPNNTQNTHIPVNATLQAVFARAMSPASFDANTSFTLRDVSNNVVPATITYSADFKTVTLQPTSNLTGGGAQYYFEVGYQTPCMTSVETRSATPTSRSPPTEVVRGRTKAVTGLQDERVPGSTDFGTRFFL